MAFGNIAPPRLGMAGTQRPELDTRGMGASLGSLFRGGGGGGGGSPGSVDPISSPTAYKLSEGGGMDVMGSIENINREVRRSVYRPGSWYGD